MNINMMDLILLCSTVVFAMIAAFLILSKMMQRKNVIKALQSSKAVLQNQLSNNANTLKTTLEPVLNPELEKKIGELISIERDSYKNLIKLYVDYHPAAIEMMPVLMNQIVSSYIQCFKHVVLSIPEKTAEIAKEEDPNELPEHFEFEALIEQLRYEKQDFANKYKDASKLLKTICVTHKEQLKLNVDESLEQMNLYDIAKLFNIELTPTKTDLIS